VASFLGITIPVFLIALSGYIIWRSTDGFETAADYLGRNLTRGIKGATINAIASSMPEFLATLFFLFYVADEGQFEDSFSGGIGITAGSAVFNILIIPIVVLFWVAITGKYHRIPLDKKLLKRDGIFLVAANLILLFIIRQRMLGVVDGVILVLIYLGYLFVLWKMLKKSPRKPNSSTPYILPSSRGMLKQIFMIDVTSWIMKGRTINARLAWTQLFISAVIMCIGTWLLVEGTQLLGSNEYSFLGFQGLTGLNIPIIFVSVILAAAASSIPDTMISMRDARKGNFDDSICNTLASNIFDISFALGFPLLLYTLINGPIEMSEMVRRWSLGIWMILFLINLVVIPIFIHSKNIGGKTGLVLLAIYVLFVFFIVEESVQSQWINRVIDLIIK